MNPTQETRDKIAVALLAWFQRHKRDLPWRGATPYGVWVSEIMLQQTQVVTVIPFYLRFMERFPTVTALAEASIEEVLTYWAGLGYYARARNLHRAAQRVAEEFGGVVPSDPVDIESLPGIGRYTAGAILSIAYSVPRPIVDANVIRVLSRVFGITGDPKSSVNQDTLWGLAEQLVPKVNPGDFNQGLMELGALVCEPVEPRCDTCPLLTFCVAGHSPDPTALPEIPPRKTAVSVTHVSVLIRNEKGELLLTQRPLHGLWGGLWEFPRVILRVGETPQEAGLRAGREVAGYEISLSKQIAKIKHSVTHHRITLYGFLASPLDISPLEHPHRVLWILPSELDRYALSAPQVLLRNAIQMLLVEEKQGTVQPILDFMPQD
ncbi:MAG: A/G-specific adenine glycosylase [Armatimonadetes bacterium]|nr:A/G-specific adenine glycosylase [Armatimonadota bacterium]